MFFFKKYGLLWQNARNLQYIKKGNFSISRKMADSKLKTKEFLSNKWVSVPETLLIIRKHKEINKEIIEKLEVPFVVKPNNGYWWKWILVFDKKDSLWNFITNTWEVYSRERLFTHLGYILDWFFSLSWLRDRVLIERKIVLDSQIDLLWKYGLPDIRVIVYNMVPVMAMFRVPTKESWGKANIHAWACWVWIDIWTWKLTFISKWGKLVKAIPWIWDVRWIKLPFWDKVLNLAVSVQKHTKIGFLWCDIVLDKDFGPILLEMNVRPGLEIQVINLSPLKTRLEKVYGISVNSVEKWVRLWRDLFSWDIEEKIRHITWKKVLGTKEYVRIFLKDKSYKYLANIKVSQSSNYINRSFLENILKVDSHWIKKIKLDCEILGQKKAIKFIIKHLESTNIILWISSLKWFLVDPFKYKKWEVLFSDNSLLKGKNIAVTKSYKKQILDIDRRLIKIDKKILILKHIAPINKEEEREKFVNHKGDYVPKFKYEPMPLDLNSLEKNVLDIEIPEIDLNNIYKRKKEEILNKIQFLKAFKKQDTSWMMNYSKKIYWSIIEDNLEYSEDVLKNKNKIVSESDFLDFEEIKDYINKFNHIYNIKINLSKWSTTARLTMKWDNLILREWEKIWKREIRSVIAHEIEGHYIRGFNGRKIDLSIFSRWTASYSEIEEWIAIYNQSRFITKKDQKFYGIFERYFFLDYCINHSYKKLVKKMEEYYEEDYNRIFNYIVRLKRWFEDISKSGCFMKDVVYVNGYLAIQDYLENWGDLKELYLWKVHIKDLEEIKMSYVLDVDFNDLKIPFFL